MKSKGKAMRPDTGTATRQIAWPDRTSGDEPAEKAWPESGPGDANRMASINMTSVTYGRTKIDQGSHPLRPQPSLNGGDAGVPVVKRNKR